MEKNRKDLCAHGIRKLDPRDVSFRLETFMEPKGPGENSGTQFEEDMNALYRPEEQEEEEESDEEDE